MKQIAYSYIRFSTPAQLKGDSLRRQLARSEKFAAQNSLSLDTSLRDLGLSGFKGAHRHKGALASFLAKIESGEIERGSWLIVENLDRLSREDVLDALELFLRIINAGVIVATLSDDMIYSRETINKRPNDLTISIAAMAKANRESRDKADRLQEAWNAKREDLAGRRKLTLQGPRWLDLVPDDPAEPLVGEWRFNERSEVMQCLFQMCADGIGKELIARRLNGSQIPPFRGGDGWQSSTVLFLLRDRRAIGEFQPHTKVDGVRRPIGDPIPGYFPAVVSKELFFRVQAELSRRHTGAHPGKKCRVPNIFVGLARCSCGRAMEFRDKSGTKYSSPKAVYLICSGAQRGHVCSNANHHTYSLLESLVLDWVTDIEVSDEEANNTTIAGIKLLAKIAERDDLKRRIVEGLAKWEELTSGILKESLFASVERNSGVLKKVEADITDLDHIVRTTKRSVLDDRRAIVGRMRQEMASLNGIALFEGRAKLASALRQVIDHIEFQADGGFRVTLIGGLKLYQFANEQFVTAFDLAEINLDRDPLLVFPSVELKDSRRWEPMTMAGLRETLEGIAEKCGIGAV